VLLLLPAVVAQAVLQVRAAYLVPAAVAVGSHGEMILL
jgi:hypothetical protein